MVSPETCPLTDSFRVNQVESAFMPLRSMLFPSHTAKAIGTDIPALNWVSLASPVSNGALHHHAPGWTSVSTTLDGTSRFPHTVSDDILMRLRREGAEAIGIQILNRAHAQRRIGHDVARPDARIEGPKASADPVRIGHAARRLFEIVVPENAWVLVVHIPDACAILAEILLPLCVPPPDVGGAA